MILALDVGNTHTVMGLMDDGEIRNVTRMASDTGKTEFEYAVMIDALLGFSKLSIENVSGAIISSVVPPITSTLSKAVEIVTGIKPMVVGAGLKTGVNIRIDNPSETGSDLVVAAAAALKYYRPPMIIIDMGTATTISVIDRDGSFIGGAIAPGVMLSLNALTDGASLLPKINLEPPGKSIGRNTVDCMKSGGVLGAASMLDGMIDRMQAELGTKDMTIIATGGISGSIIPLCTHKIEIEENLLLKGLYVIYEKNVKAR